MNLRKAYAKESDYLNHIAFESEGIWGEDESYMAHFSQDYCVTEDMILNDYVYVLEEGSKLVGFFAVLKGKDMGELELFYVEKSYIGKGYGKILWNEMLALCKEKNIEKIGLVASKDVADFYEKLGAVETKKMKSTLQVGRIVSRFEYQL